MECVLSRYPSDIFKQIVSKLEDENLGLLYLTGDTQLMKILKYSVSQIKYMKPLFNEFPSIEMIDTVTGNGNPLPPSLKQINNFIIMEENCMKVILKSVIRLGLSCENVEDLDGIPETVETLVVDDLTLYDNYTFRNGYKHTRVHPTLDRQDIPITFFRASSKYICC